MKTILIGASGYIGSSLDADIRISRNDIDLLDFGLLKSLLTKHRPTHLIGAAAKHGSFQEMQKNHSDFLRTNLLIDSNILEASRQCGIESVLLLSSISGLPESSKTSNERDLSNGSVSITNFGYNFSKYASTQLIKSYQMDGMTGYRSLLLGNIYGYNKRFKDNSNVVATVIKLMYNAMKSNLNLELYGSGRDRRCFTHLRDLNAIIAKIQIAKDSNTEPVIVSDSRDNSIRDLVTYVAESMDFPNEIKFKDLATEKYTIKKIDNSNLLKSIGDHNFLDLEYGIGLTVTEYLHNLSVN